MADELTLMRTFVRVLERGSLSAVAREMGVGQSTVSRHLKDLEDALGITLLQRTTRRLNVTEPGALYLERARTILTFVEQTHEAVRGSRSAIEGLIRLSCPSAFGALHVCRCLFAFQGAHPRVRIDLRLTDARIDLVREGVDMVLRFGPLAESTLVARRIGSSRRFLVASPEYLRRCGEPRKPSDLTRHNGIRLTTVAGSDRLEFFDRAGNAERVSFGGDFQADQALAIREALIAGRGLGPAHYWLVADLLAAGKLQILLPEYRLGPVPLHLVTVPKRTKIARVSLLADFLMKEVSQVPGVVRAP